MKKTLFIGFMAMMMASGAWAQQQGREHHGDGQHRDGEKQEMRGDFGKHHGDGHHGDGQHAMEGREFHGEHHGHGQQGAHGQKGEFKGCPQGKQCAPGQHGQQGAPCKKGEFHGQQGAPGQMHHAAPGKDMHGGFHGQPGGACNHAAGACQHAGCAGGQVMEADAQQVSAIIKYLKDINMEADRLEAAKKCTHMYAIETRDLERIAKLFNFDENRLEFYKAAYRNCPDKGNYITLKNSFTFSSNFDKLVEYIAR